MLHGVQYSPPPKGVILASKLPLENQNKHLLALPENSYYISEHPPIFNTKYISKGWIPHRHVTSNLWNKHQLKEESLLEVDSHQEGKDASSLPFLQKKNI